MKVLALLVHLPFMAVAFHNPMIHTRLQSSTVLYAADRRNVLASSAVALASTFLRPIDDARADDNLSGRIVQFQVANLDDGSSGTIKIQLEPDWAPKGVARFEELVSIGFYQNCRFFRVLPGFVAQFGINGDPALQAKWKSNPISDDPVRVGNDRGTVVFATAGPNTRTTQLFINTNKSGNGFLDKQGFSPIGKVIEGMELVDKFYAGYGEGAPSGRGPSQGLLQVKGNSYLDEGFPKLTYITEAKFL